MRINDLIANLEHIRKEQGNVLVRVLENDGRSVFAASIKSVELYYDKRYSSDPLIRIKTGY